MSESGQTEKSSILSVTSALFRERKSRVQFLNERARQRVLNLLEFWTGFWTASHATVFARGPARFSVTLNGLPPQHRKVVASGIDWAVRLPF